MSSPSIKQILLLVVAVTLFSDSYATAAQKEKPSQGKELLLKTYHKNMTRLESNSFGLPLYLESLEQNNQLLLQQQNTAPTNNHALHRTPAIYNRCVTDDGLHHKSPLHMSITNAKIILKYMQLRNIPILYTAGTFIDR